MRVLPYTAGASFAYGINASGDVAGAIKSPPDELWEHAVIWHKRRLVALGSLGASSGYGIARAINNRRQAVGFSETPSGTSHAFVWTSDDGMTDLAPTMIYSEATAINDRGDIVGWFSNGQPTGAIWRAR
jgi:probable HAF family extracellular repeat protein